MLMVFVPSSALVPGELERSVGSCACVAVVLVIIEEIWIWIWGLSLGSSPWVGLAMVVWDSPGKGDGSTLDG